MIRFKPVVRRRIEALAEYVEIHNEGALRGVSEYTPFNQAQAETYLNFYQGYKREVQEQSLESGLVTLDDPLYGWGWIAQHEPQVRLIGAAHQEPIPVQGEAHKKQSLLQKQQQSAELHVVKRPHIVATLPMYILHATIAPTIVPDIDRGTIISRIQRVKKQIKSPGIAEKLSQLRCLITAQGVEIRIYTGDDYQIGPIN